MHFEERCPSFTPVLQVIMRVVISTIIVAVLLMGSLSPRAGDSLDPILSPEAAVHIQLRALQNNDVPRPDSGIRKAWAFAHPANKRLTGPLPKFIAMIKQPAYAMLLNHQNHEIKLLERSASIAVFAIRVTANDGLVYLCRWQVARVSGGENDGAWLTIGVSPLMAVGKET